MATYHTKLLWQNPILPYVQIKWSIKPCMNEKFVGSSLVSAPQLNACQQQITQNSIVFVLDNSIHIMFNHQKYPALSGCKWSNGWDVNPRYRLQCSAAHQIKTEGLFSMAYQKVVLATYYNGQL